MFSPFTAKGSTGQMLPEVGNFMHMSKAALVPNSYDSVKKKTKTNKQIKKHMKTHVEGNISLVCH